MTERTFTLKLTNDEHSDIVAALLTVATDPSFKDDSETPERLKALAVKLFAVQPDA